MEKQAIFKALKYFMLPTLIWYVLYAIGSLSLNAPIDSILGKGESGVMLRLFLTIVEIISFLILYFRFKDQILKKNELNNLVIEYDKKLLYCSSFQDINIEINNEVYLYKTNNENIFVIQAINK